MATYYSSYSNEYRLRLDITQGTQNVTNNTSVVSWTLYLQSGNKSMSVYSTFNATVNGVTSPSTTQTNVNIGYNSTVTLGSGSTTVTHNSDGTKSVAFSASFKTNSPVYYGGVLVSPGTMTISGNFALTTIPRYASITAFTVSTSGLSATLSWSADKTISQWRWSPSSGSSYSAWITANAKSGSFTGPMNPGQTYGFRIEVKDSVSGLITTSSVVSRTAPTYAAITAFTVSINDLTASWSWTSDKTISQWRWSANSGSSYSEWITVNAKSGSSSGPTVPGRTYGFRIEVKDSVTGLITTSSVVSKTATKTPSTLSLNTSSQNVGGGVTWTVHESYDYTHQIIYYFGSTSGYILGSSSSALNTATGLWNVPTAVANQMPNATSMSGTIRIRTYHGSVHIGTKDYAFTAKVPNDTTWQPAVPTVGISDAVTQPGGITSYVHGKSKANVVSSSTAQGGASISSYRVTVSGIGTYYGSNVTSGTLNQSGAVTVTVRATDSRGYYREKASTITVAAYSPPKLTTYTALRSPNEQGTDLATSINFSISSVNSQNTKQYSIRYRPSGGTWVSLVDSTDYYTRSTTHSATDVLDANTSYEVEFYIKDSYTSVTQIRRIGTAFQLLDFNTSGKGVAFGKVSEKDAFEVGLPAEFSGGIEPIKIPTGSNINDYQTPGFYYNNFTAETGTMTNIARSAAFSLIVYRDSGVTQIWNDYATDNHLSYMRSYYEGTWSDWKAFSMDGHTHTTGGSNTNGRYVRFTDGTQICWGSVNITATFFAWGNIFAFEDTTTTTYPAAFIERPSLNVTGASYSYAAMVVAAQGHETGINRITIARGVSSNVTYPFYYIAIGRWK